MTEPQFEDRSVDAGFPEVVDDDSPERERYPEPEAPALASDVGYVGTDSVGTTVEEEIEGESLDQKLAREEPQPEDTGLAERLDADLPAGPLVAPDQGGGEDAEKDEVASEVGRPASDASPEEQAMTVREPGAG